MAERLLCRVARFTLGPFAFPVAGTDDELRGLSAWFVALHPTACVGPAKVVLCRRTATDADPPADDAAMYGAAMSGAFGVLVSRGSKPADVRQAVEYWTRLKGSQYPKWDHFV